MNVFLNEVKKAGGILIKFWYPGMSVYEIDQEVAVAPLILSLKDPGHDPWVGWLSSSPGGWLGLRLWWWL